MSASMSCGPPSTLESPTSFFFFFNDTATTEIYTLSLHDALPICRPGACAAHPRRPARRPRARRGPARRSEEHTSELQSLTNLVCRLLLEKKKKGEHRKSCRRDHPVTRITE